jgi:hypothetical protein
MGLVAEMGSGLEQLLHCDDVGRHWSSPSGSSLDGASHRPCGRHRYVSSACGMRRALAEERRLFNHLQIGAIHRLTSENKMGTLVRPGAANAGLKQGRIHMLGPIFSLFFLGCFWIAGSLALQQLYDSRSEILEALSGRGGVKRWRTRAGA